MQAEHKIRTLAHQLTEILVVYARSFDSWRADPGDLAGHERAQSNLELVRVLTDKAFPGGRGEAAELLGCHAELKLLVLRLHMGLPAAGSGSLDAQVQLANLLERHQALLNTLTAVCTQRSGHKPEPPQRPAPSLHPVAPRPGL